MEPNIIKRYSVGTKNKDLATASDGSLTIYVQSDAPTDPGQRANWLPSPKDGDFSLYIRAYWPEDELLSTRGILVGPIQDRGDIESFEMRDTEGHLIQVCNQT